MGRISDYDSGRRDGLRMAMQIVKESGLEELEKEIRFRNITGINTSIPKKELEKACEKIKNRTLDTMLVISVSVLHDKFDWGRVRCQRYIDHVNNLADSLIKDMCTWDDYIQMIKDEMKIEMVIRDND